MSKDFDDVSHIEMNLENAHLRFAEEDFDKLYDGAFLTADELNKCRGVSASCGIKINNEVTGDYLVILEDGTVQVGTW